MYSGLLVSTYNTAGFYISGDRNVNNLLASKLKIYTSEFFQAVEDKSIPVPNYAPSAEVVWGSRELEPHILSLDTRRK